MTDASAFDPPRQTVIAVCGPTATGKTDVGVALAQVLESEVISADSRLVYRKLNIGTAKPTQAEIQGVAHHMIDIVCPTEQYSAARYQAEAEPVLTGLLQKQKIPVVVGGTGFYHRSLLEEGIFPDVPPNEEFRKEMNAVVAEKGAAYLHRRLQEKDPARARALYTTDAFRIIRALEIIHATGQPVPKNVRKKPFDVVWAGLTFEDWDALRQKIETRVNRMLHSGWVEEVEGLLAAYGPHAEALKVSHGYPELVGYIQGEWSLEEAKSRITVSVQQYARRQRTWFKKNKAVHWFSIDRVGVEKTVVDILTLLQASRERN